MTHTDSDISRMRRALAIAAQGRTSPNPMVGAVIVRDGTIVGEGFHRAAGEAHAEVVAIRNAGEKTLGSIMYVTLEPCCHYGRTPPCTAATIAAGINRVVVAMEDPDAQVAGRGIAALRAAGITVEVGLLEAEAHRLNAAYIHHRRTGLPFVLVKLAQTMDGRIATLTGHSQWITGPEARTRAHRLRSESDGVLVGIGTVLADDPQLTVRHVEGRQPRRIILDSHARTPSNARILSADTLLPIICITDRAPEERVAALRATGAEILTLPHTQDGRIDLSALLRCLGEQPIVTLLVEGGSRVVTAFLKMKAAQQVACFIAPALMGEGLPAVGDLGARSMDQVVRLRDIQVEQIGEDILVTGFPEYGID